MQYLPLNIKNYLSENLGLVIRKREEEIIEEFLNHRNLNFEQLLKNNNLQDLINLITVNETYFFRDKNQINFFKKNAGYLSYKKKDLNIWCLACSSGEEVYTLSIILEELNLKTQGTKIQGFDINTGYLEKAKKGIYSNWSFRGLDEVFINKYFNKVKNGYEIKNFIKSNTFFHYFNLKKDLFSNKLLETYGQPDIIFCRNVLMYFDKETLNEIIDKFKDLLSSDGFLITGIQEVPLLSKSESLKCVSIDGTYIFKLKDEKEIINSDKLSNTKNVISKIKIKRGSTKNKFCNSENEIQKPLKIESSQSSVDILAKKYDAYQEIFNYISVGNSNKCSEYISQLLKKDKDSYLLYYLESLNYYIVDNIEKSEYFLKKALFLNSSSALLNYHYANIYLKKNDNKRALKYLHSADKNLKLSDDEYLKYLDNSFESLKNSISIMIKMLEESNINV